LISKSVLKLVPLSVPDTAKTSAIVAAKSAKVSLVPKSIPALAP